MPEWDGDRGGHLWPRDREATSADGAHIRYTWRGRAGAPWVVLCSGYLCPDNFWAFLAPALAERYRVVLLNYRSVGASTDPHPGRGEPRVADYTMARLAGDVLAVMDAEGIERAAMVGHSMGCQVALEVHRVVGAERVGALALLAGPYASPFRSFYGSQLGAYLFPLLYAGARLAPPTVIGRIPRLAQAPGVLHVARLLRATGPLTPAEQMLPYLQHFSNVSADVALKLAMAMYRHDAGDVLETIDVPTLIVVGGRDTFTPSAIGREMHERIRDSEFLEIPGGSHCTTIEFPDETNNAVLGFLDRRLTTTRT